MSNFLPASSLTVTMGGSSGPAGTSPPAVNLLNANSNDYRGTIAVGTGTSPAASTTVPLVSIQFAGNYSSPYGPAIPFLVVTFQGVHLPAGITYAAATNLFAVYCPTAAPAASLPATQAGGIVISWHMDA